MTVHSDKIILDQAILRHQEREYRQKREISFHNGPGWISVGSVFDCNRKSFERALRDYSDRLYVGWNPFKREGRGCWEVWHRPSQKTPVLRYYDEITGIKIATLEYLPNDFEHWVADLEYLSYDFIGKLRKMDAWENKQLISGQDDLYEEERAKAEKAEDEHIKYVVKHNKQAFRDLLDYTQSGYNPLDFFTKS